MRDQDGAALSLRQRATRSAIDIITFEGAFHGRTLATIAAGGQTKYLEGFGPKVAGFDQVPFGDREALEGGDRRGDRGDPDRADPGRGRHPPGPAG